MRNYLLMAAAVAFLGAGAMPAQTLPGFFNGQVSLGGGWYYLQLSDGSPFGYYYTPSYPWIYHQDLGWEYVTDAQDGANGIYMGDSSSGHTFYTTPGSFPWMYDFNLTAGLIYQAVAGSPGNYTSNPRLFYNLVTLKYTEFGAPLAVPSSLSINNGGSTGSALAGVNTSFTFTYVDQWNGGSDVQYGQVWLQDSSGNQYCHSQWGNDGSLYLFDASPYYAATPGTVLTDAFCSISLAATPSPSGTALPVALNMNFLPAAQDPGIYSIMTVVYDAAGDESPYATMGSFTVNPPPYTVSPMPTNSSMIVDGFTYHSPASFLGTHTLSSPSGNPGAAGNG